MMDNHIILYRECCLSEKSVFLNQNLHLVRIYLIYEYRLHLIKLDSYFLMTLSIRIYTNKNVKKFLNNFHYYFNTLLCVSNVLKCV